jgi:hypothetical protein
MKRLNVAGLSASVIIAAGLVAGTAQAESSSQDCQRWTKVLNRTIKGAKKESELKMLQMLPDIILGAQAACGGDWSEHLRLARETIAFRKEIIALRKANRNAQRVLPSQPAPAIIVQVPLFDEPRPEPDMFIDCVTDKIAGIVDTMCSGTRF